MLKQYTTEDVLQLLRTMLLDSRYMARVEKSTMRGFEMKMYDIDKRGNKVPVGRFLISATKLPAKEEKP